MHQKPNKSKKIILMAAAVLLSFFGFASIVKALNATSFSPADNATGVTGSSNLVINFDMAASSYMMGNLYIYDGNGNLFESFQVAPSPSARISGLDTTTITIDPSSDMTSGKNYYVMIDNWGFRDAMWSSYSISSSTTWNFTVGADTTPPTVSSYTPADGATAISTTTNLTILFNEAIDIRTGNLYIRKTADDTTAETISVASAQVTGNGTTTISINPSITLAANTGYYINFDSGVFYDLAGNNYGALTANGTWNFTSDCAAIAGWYNCNWAYRKKITVLNTKVNGDLADFPVMVDLSNLGSATFMAHVKTDGSDIVVTNSTGNGTKLARELESINTTANTGILWFKAANIYNATDTDFYIYYGNSSASETNSTSTWKSSYQIVSHFAETPTSSDADAEFQDSTVNNKDGTSKGSMPTSNKIAGQIGNGLKLDGSNDYVDYGNLTAIDTKTKYTLSTWFKRTNTTSTMPIFDKGASSSIIHIYNDGTYKLSENTYASYETYSDTQDTNWHYIVNTFDGTGSGNSGRFKFYVDGAEKTLTYNHTVAASSGGGGYSLYLGYHSTMMVSTAYAGARFDEVHVSNGTYTAAWIKTEYDNQYSPSTFYTVAAEETPVSDSTNPTVSSYSPTDNSTAVSTNSNLIITFSEAVETQTGNIVIKRSSNGGVLQTIAIGSAYVTGNGTTAITIDPPSDLPSYTGVYINIDATAIDDLAGNSYAGISDGTTWNFTTGSCTNSRPSDWYGCSWSKRIKVTIDDSKVNGSVSNFPVYLDLSTLPSTFFDDVLANGADLRVTKSNGTTEVAREVVWLNKTSNGGELHFVANGTLSNAANSDYYLYYGNGSASEPSASSTYGKNKVWVNSYAGVWHLEEAVNNTTNGYTDSTSNLMHGTGTSMSFTAPTGKLSGKAQDFDGTADYINLPLVADPTAYTFSVWLNADTVTSTSILVRTDSAGPTVNWSHQLSFTAASKVQHYVYASGTNTTFGITSVNTSTWYHVVGTAANRSKIELFLDGVLYATLNISNDMWTSGDRYRLASNSGGSLGYYNGRLDELRISNVVRNGSWIKTEYNNQSSPTTFYRFSSSENYVADTTAPTVSSFSPSDNATGVSPTSNLVIVFSESVVVGTGNITIKKSSDNSTVQTIAITNGAVTGTGTTTITIDPPSDLAGSTSYYINIASTCITDSSSNAYAGISDTTTWNFTTGASGTPTIFFDMSF